MTHELLPPTIPDRFSAAEVTEGKAQNLVGTIKDSLPFWEGSQQSDGAGQLAV